MIFFASVQVSRKRCFCTLIKLIEAVENIICSFLLAMRHIVRRILGKAFYCCVIHHFVIGRNVLLFTFLQKLIKLGDIFVYNPLPRRFKLLGTPRCTRRVGFERNVIYISAGLYLYIHICLAFLFGSICKIGFYNRSLFHCHFTAGSVYFKGLIISAVRYHERVFIFLIQITVDITAYPCVPILIVPQEIQNKKILIYLALDKSRCHLQRLLSFAAVVIINCGAYHNRDGIVKAFECNFPWNRRFVYYCITVCLCRRLYL